MAQPMLISAADQLSTLQSMLRAALALAQNLSSNDNEAYSELMDVLALANICVLRMSEGAMPV